MLTACLQVPDSFTLGDGRPGYFIRSQSGQLKQGLVLFFLAQMANIVEGAWEEIESTLAIESACRESFTFSPLKQKLPQEDRERPFTKVGSF